MMFNQAQPDIGKLHDDMFWSAVGEYNNQVNDITAFIFGGEDAVRKLLVDMVQVSISRAEADSSRLMWEVENILQSVAIATYVLDNNSLTFSSSQFHHLMEGIGYGNHKSLKSEDFLKYAVSLFDAIVDKYNSDFGGGEDKSIAYQAGKFFVDYDITAEYYSDLFKAEYLSNEGKCHNRYLEQLSPCIKLHILLDITRRLGRSLSGEDYAEFMALSRKEINKKYYPSSDCLTDTVANHSDLKFSQDNMEFHYVSYTSIKDNIMALSGCIPQRCPTEEELDKLSQLGKSITDIADLVIK